MKLRLDFGGQNAVQLMGDGATAIDAVLRPEAFKSFVPGAPGSKLTVECVLRGPLPEYLRADDCTIHDPAWHRE